MNRTARLFFWGALGGFVAVSLVAMESGLAIPQATRRWIVFLAIAPALSVLAEMVAERLWSSRIGQVISNHPSSGVRIIFGVMLGSTVLAAALGITWLFNIAI